MSEFDPKVLSLQVKLCLGASAGAVIASLLGVFMVVKTGGDLALHMSQEIDNLRTGLVAQMGAVDMSVKQLHQDAAWRATLQAALEAPADATFSVTKNEQGLVVLKKVEPPVIPEAAEAVVAPPPEVESKTPPKGK